MVLLPLNLEMCSILEKGFVEGDDKLLGLMWDRLEERENDVLSRQVVSWGWEVAQELQMEAIFLEITVKLHNHS